MGYAVALFVGVIIGWCAAAVVIGGAMGEQAPVPDFGGAPVQSPFSNQTTQQL